MKLYLDSADLGAVTPLLNTGLFEGVTTNPLILERAGVRLAQVPDLVQALRAAGARTVFVQAVKKATPDIVAEGIRIAEFSDDVVVKVPATREGLAATVQLTMAGVPVLITAVYHMRQAILARSAEAWGVAPYVGRMDDAGRDGLCQVQQMQAVLEGSSTRVLAASIRGLDIVQELALLGAGAVTISPTVAHGLLDDELTKQAVSEFDDATRSLV